MKEGQAGMKFGNESTSSVLLVVQRKANYLVIPTQQINFNNKRKNYGKCKYNWFWFKNGNECW